MDRGGLSEGRGCDMRERKPVAATTSEEETERMHDVQKQTLRQKSI